MTRFLLLAVGAAVGAVYVAFRCWEELATKEAAPREEIWTASNYPLRIETYPIVIHRPELFVKVEAN